MDCVLEEMQSFEKAATVDFTEHYWKSLLCPI
jgi:hypothetical protein